jgi:hypothetical protein
VRHGPMVRRSPHTSRLTHGATTPLARLHSMRGLGALQVPNDHRSRNDSYGLLESPRLNLMGMLPINLRHFLADRLGPMLHIDDDSNLEFDPRWGDRAVRELARAIRRFSAERARELWRECAVQLGRLASELARIPARDRHIVLCLRCGSIGVGPEAAGRHLEPACLAIELNRALDPDAARVSAAHALGPDGLRRAVENFRLRRAAAGLAHFDLDCYLSNDQMVFTWRPLPARDGTPAETAPSVADGSRSDERAPLRAERSIECDRE